MMRFFDGPEDLAEHIRIADSRIMPLLDHLDGDPVKLQTALFVIFTRRAIRNHGLTRENAHNIVDSFFDAD